MPGEPDDTREGELIQAVLRAQLAAIRAQEPGVRADQDVEATHAMRVAIRRLQAALRVYGDVLPPWAAELRAQLRTLGEALGGVRDVDVLLERLAALEVAPDTPEAAAVELIQARQALRRAGARAALVELLDGAAFSSLLAELDRLAVGVPAGDKLRAVTPRRVRRSFRRLRRAGDAVGPATADEAALHALRLRAKRLRYVVEFVTPVYGRSARRLVRALVRLQDAIGEHRDALAAATLADTLRGDLAAERLTAEQAAGLAKLRDGWQADADRQRARIARAYARVRGKRWRRLRRALRRAANGAG